MRRNAVDMRTHGGFGAYKDQSKSCIVSLTRLMRLWVQVQSVSFTIGFTVSPRLHPSVHRRADRARNDGRCFTRLSRRRAFAPQTAGSKRQQRLAKHPILARPVSSAEEAIDSASGPLINPKLDHFVTPPLQVYIEDTDAYGVMYNGNYLRAYDRALHMTLAPSPSTSSAALGDRDDWSIVSVEELKFKSPPPLGGTYCIEGTRRRRPKSSSSHDASFANDSGNGTSKRALSLPEGTTVVLSSLNGANVEEEEVWNMIMRSPDGSIVYNTATGVTLARSSSTESAVHDESPPVDWLPFPPHLFPADGSSATTTTTSSIDSFRTYRDEFEPHLDSHVPLRIALNYMERTRTNSIGGPSMLHELQHTHGVLYVVTAVRNCSLVSYRTDSIHGGGDSFGRRTKRPRLVPGMQVDVETTFRARKRGAIIDCYHTVVLEDATDPIQRHRMAQGVVTIMALDAATRRPTNKLPSWLKSRFDVSDPAT